MDQRRQLGVHDRVVLQHVQHIARGGLLSQPGLQQRCGGAPQPQLAAIAQCQGSGLVVAGAQGGLAPVALLPAVGLNLGLHRRPALYCAGEADDAAAHTCRNRGWRLRQWPRPLPENGFFAGLVLWRWSCRDIDLICQLQAGGAADPGAQPGGLLGALGPEFVLADVPVADRVGVGPGHTSLVAETAVVHQGQRPDAAPEQIAQEPLVHIGGFLGGWPVGAQQRRQIRQHAGHPAPQASQDRIGVAPPVAHHMEPALGGQPLLHRRHLPLVHHRIAIAHQEAPHGRIVGHLEAPAELLAHALARVHQPDLSAEALQQFLELQGHRGVQVEAGLPTRIEVGDQQGIA